MKKRFVIALMLTVALIAGTFSVMPVNAACKHSASKTWYECKSGKCVKMGRCKKCGKNYVVSKGNHSYGAKSTLHDAKRNVCGTVRYCKNCKHEDWVSKNKISNKVKYDAYVDYHMCKYYCKNCNKFLTSKDEKHTFSKGGVCKYCKFKRSLVKSNSHISS